MDADMEQAVREEIYKYVRQLEDARKIGHALKRLESIPMTLGRLLETGVGKAVNSLRNNPEHGSYAQHIVEQWKSIVWREALEEKTVKREPADSPQAVKHEEAEEEEQHADPDRYSPAPMIHQQKVKYEPREASESPPSPVSNGKHRAKERRRSPSPPPKVKRESVDDRLSESHPKKKRMLEASRSPPVEQDSRWKHKVTAETSESPSEGLRKRTIVKSEPTQDMDPFAATLLAAEKLPPTRPKTLKPSTSAGGSSSSSYRSDGYVEPPESAIEALRRSVQSVPMARGSSSLDVTEAKSHAAGRRTGRTKTLSGEVPSIFQMCMADPNAPGNACKAQIHNGIVVSSARVPAAAELSTSRRLIFVAGVKNRLPPWVDQSGWPRKKLNWVCRKYSKFRREKRDWPDQLFKEAFLKEIAEWKGGDAATAAATTSEKMMFMGDVPPNLDIDGRVTSNPDANGMPHLCMSDAAPSTSG